MTDEAAEPAWEYFDYDNAQYRRPAGLIGGVTDVLSNDGTWKPYTGADRTKQYLFGDRINNPKARVAKVTT